MVTNILEVDSVLYRIKDHNLLTDIYLKCQTGEIIGLLGRNGTGKSTLLKIIFGTLPTDNKNIRVNGKPQQQPYKQNLVSYLPQESFLPRSLQVKKLTPLFVPTVAKQQLLQQDAHIQSFLHQNPTELSGGQLRYLEVALLLQLEAPFVLLDEPFSGLEPLFKEQIQQLLLAHRTSKGILLTDHNYQDIIKVSDRIVLLHKGTTKAIRQLKELEDWKYLPAGRLSESNYLL